MATPTSPVTGVDFITVFSSDLEASEAFYTSVLGLPRTAVYQRGDTPPMGLEFETGTVTLSVVHSAAMGIDQTPNRHPIAFRVDEVAAARAELESRGVQFKADTLDSGVCHMAFFADPDGNALMLHHRYAPKGG